MVVDTGHSQVLYGHAVGRGGEAGRDGTAGLVEAVTFHPHIVGSVAGKTSEGKGSGATDGGTVAARDVVDGRPVDNHVVVVGGVYLTPVDGGDIIANTSHVDIGRRCAGAITPHADVVHIVVTITGAAAGVVIAESDVTAGASVVAEINLEIILCIGAGIVDNLDGVKGRDTVGIAHHTNNQTVAGRGAVRPEAHA